MSHEAGGDEIALRRRHPPTAAPLDDEDLLGEILLRVPPAVLLAPPRLPRLQAARRRRHRPLLQPPLRRPPPEAPRPQFLREERRGAGLHTHTRPRCFRDVASNIAKALSKFVLSIFFNVPKSIAWCSSSLCLYPIVISKRIHLKQDGKKIFVMQYKIICC
ncbi:hypothetical protein ACQJBY_058439 [Aegilops geniculata]